MPITEYMADGDRMKTKNEGQGINDYVQDQYFTAQQNFSVDQGRSSGGGTVILGGFPAYILRKDTSDFIDYSFNKPSHWRKGTCKVTVYTSDGSGASDEEYFIQVRVKGAQVGVGFTDILAETGQAINTVAQEGYGAFVVVSTSYILTTPQAWGIYDLISLRVKRLFTDPLDTMDTQDAYFYGARIEYRPSQSQ